MSFTPEDHPRAATGEFTTKDHSAPEAALAGGQPPLTERISAYLDNYAAAADTYEEEGDDGYEDWEDFQTDNSGYAVDLLTDAQAEITRLRAELEARQDPNSHAIPTALLEHIHREHPGIEEPLLYVPSEGHSGGYIDVIAYVDGETPHKYTMDPDGDITSFAARA